ncbi:hypothetical protein FW778_11225 [Ginsengibacter hankyongi]|uniref:Uncharacterized protein n=1 Tax=Ginsengibacter hankyongi TaxID=2607284 RepID=A0A5J5IGI9_9BACT|nr:hypothetical protein [Ginsengibacter hankyongi]KAA9039390.1 hypothetical protein FW778_11225 [Ginsengibacter hankyongi]
MINIKYLLSYSLLTVSLYACAQSKYSIKNIYAVYEVHLPGNIAVDQNGNEIPSRDTLNVVYVETSSGPIQWNEAWKNDKTYSILSHVADTNFIDAGTDKNTNEKMIIHASPGNKLWQLRLIPSDSKISLPAKILQNEILLEGTYNGKKILQKIKKQVELNSIPSQ